MKITEELLETIIKRAHSYATIKYGNEPDYLKAYNDGELYAVWETYCCGNTDQAITTFTDTELITAENLTEDLDEVAKQREIDREIQRKKDLEERQKTEREQQQRELAQRKEQYLKLKKEFEV